MAQLDFVNHRNERSAAVEHAKCEWEKLTKREHYRMISEGIPILVMADNNTSPIDKLQSSLLSFFEQHPIKDLVNADVKPAPTFKKINSSLLSIFGNQATEAFVAAEENVPAVTIKKRLDSSLLSTFGHEAKSLVGVADENSPITSTEKLDKSLLSLFNDKATTPTEKEASVTNEIISKLDLSRWSLSTSQKANH